MSDFDGDRNDLGRPTYCGVQLPIDPPSSPWHIVKEWWDEAHNTAAIQRASGATVEPSAAAWATVDETGYPDVRVVLIRDVSPAGLTMFSHARSAKGRQMSATPRAAITMYWPWCDRQVRVAGDVVEISTADAARYWATRPKDSQIAARASHQSAPILSRADLVAAFDAELAMWDDEPVAPPADWRGYQLVPSRVELWVGMPGRLHDRLRYVAGDGDFSAPLDAGCWGFDRLQP